MEPSWKHSGVNDYNFFPAIACHKFVITFCVGLELATNDTRLISFIAYMVTFCLATPAGIGIGIAVSEAALLENPAYHFLTISALQGKPFKAGIRTRATEFQFEMSPMAMKKLKPA